MRKAWRPFVTISFCGVLLGMQPAIGATTPIELLLDAVKTGPGVRLQRDDDGAGVSLRLGKGKTSGWIRLGPVPVRGPGAVRFTAALSVPAGLTLRIQVHFSAKGMTFRPVQAPFSEYAARVGGVFQDLFVSAPPGAERASMELLFARTAGTEAALRLRYPCLTALPAAAASPETDDALVFRQSFSFVDGRADWAKDAKSLYPVWSCVLPVARGEDGPGLPVRRAEEAVAFRLPKQPPLLSRGCLSFWLKPLWSMGDARPADMAKLTQGKARALVRKNHGWSFLFVIWDVRGKTHSVSCSLKNLPRERWTKVEAVWAAEKGLRLILNGVVLGKKDDAWPAGAGGNATLRIGQGEYDRKERAPYVLDDIELWRRLPKGRFGQ